MPIAFPIQAEMSAVAGTRNVIFFLHNVATAGRIFFSKSEVCKPTDAYWYPIGGCGP